jgi:hypothetical protein
MTVEGVLSSQLVRLLDWEMPRLAPSQRAEARSADGEGQLDSACELRAERAVTRG